MLNNVLGTILGDVDIFVEKKKKQQNRQDLPFVVLIIFRWCVFVSGEIFTKFVSYRSVESTVLRDLMRLTHLFF